MIPPVSGLTANNPFKNNLSTAMPVRPWNPSAMQNDWKTTKTSFAEPTIGLEAAQQSGFFKSTNKPTFEGALNKLVGEMDSDIKAPEALINRYLTVGDVDVHDIMIANTKSDITVNVASQIATKIIQAYERIQQIQV